VRGAGAAQFSETLVETPPVASVDLENCIRPNRLSLSREGRFRASH
jgi:hypothetical protein